MKTVFLWVPCLGLSFLWAGPERIRYHQDVRETPHLILAPEYRSVDGETAEDTARRYVREHWARFEIAPSAENLVLTETQKSLTGDHFRFQQMLRGFPVEGAQLVVSVERDSGRIYRVFNQTRPVRSTVQKAPTAMLDKDEALDLAWQHLGVYGELRQIPSARAVYLADGTDFRLAYRVSLPVDGPFGAWSLAVDAVDGSVLEVRDLIHYENGRIQDYPQPHQLRLSDRELETGRLQRKLEKEKERRNRIAAKRVTGRATVFDPDPRTTLNEENIDDNDSPATFTNAYVERDLLDITFDQNTGEYELSGPWCEVAALTSQFTSPNTPPSKTMDGNWFFQRGNNAFNDAMTYFHIDQNQRYIQSLGFTGEMGLQNTEPILLDTDGVSGQDQSFYDPSVNALVFGHGCVDDNEDADVIIHEYWHGLQVFVNPFYGANGDEGAIGEGFADYWAGSYSLSTPNGPVFHPEWMFSWDGHNFCWPGRLMDQFQARYQSNRLYGAHQPLGSYNSDELWATPLFQALLRLYNRGIPISETDRIVLESNFGLTVGMRMPDTAEVVVDAAKMLYPNGPHANVLQNAFAHHEILDPVDTYNYVALHVPPTRTAQDWMSEIQLFNPNDAAATVTATVYEAVGGAVTGTVTPLAIDPFQTLVFEPGGSEQRWVRFVSDQPLAGTLFFSRSNETLGSERAGIPLAGGTETATELLLPHVPADRANFWSGAVLVNPNDSVLSLDIQLIGSEGSDLSHLLLPSAPTELSAREKFVTFLAEGPGGVPGLFDDNGSAEKVSYVRLSGDKRLVAGQLYGYNAVQGEVASAGIIAQPDQARSYYPVRVGLADVDFSGFSVLNPTEAGTTLQVQVIGADAGILAEAEIALAGNRKLLGLNTAGGFRFPSTGTPVIDLPNGADVQTVLIRCEAPLRIFELVGDNGVTQLDGTAVLGLATQAVFTRPKGKLEILKVEREGTVSVTSRIGGTATTESLMMGPGQTVQIDFSDPAVDSVEIQGELFSAALVDLDAENRSIAVINAKQVD